MAQPSTTPCHLAGLSVCPTALDSPPVPALLPPVPNNLCSEPKDMACSPLLASFIIYALTAMSSPRGMSNGSVITRQGLITCLQSAIQFSTPFPNDTLSPNWNLTNAIVTTLRATNLQHIFEHITGHQDKHVTYDLLPLEAQLNCDTYHKAVNHQTLYQAYHPQVPRLFANHAQLHNGNSTINYSYSTAICNATSKPGLEQHLQKTNNWDTRTMETICWTFHTQALNRMQACHIQLVKLCYGILPTVIIIH
jgi:hypothetical protein